MSNSLPKKQTLHHLIASRNVYFFCLYAFQNLYNSVLIQSEDCLSAVLLRALPGKSEDFSFYMKQRHNVQFTSEEVNFSLYSLLREMRTFSLKYISKPLQFSTHPIRRLSKCCLAQGASRKIRRFFFLHETAT